MYIYIPPLPKNIISHKRKKHILFKKNKTIPYVNKTISHVEKSSI